MGIEYQHPDIHKADVQDGSKMKALKSGYQHEVQSPQYRRLLKAYLHIVRRGISFEKLSRVPTCNIQDA